jgi:hypothetical protein
MGAANGAITSASMQPLFIAESSSVTLSKAAAQTPSLMMLF